MYSTFVQYIALILNCSRISAKSLYKRSCQPSQSPRDFLENHVPVIVIVKSPSEIDSSNTLFLSLRLTVPIKPICETVL